MKTIRTIATIMFAAFLVLGPLAAFAAGETVTVSTNAPTYSGTNTVQVTGTVIPAPTAANTAVIVTTKGPGGVVDSGFSSVATGTGAFNYAFVAGGPMMSSGTYTVNATYGGPGGSGSGTATFQYTGATTTGQTTTVTTTITTAVSTATVTTTVASSDAAALSSIQTTLAGITASIAVLTTGFGTINSGIQTLTTNLATLQTSVNTMSTAVTQLNTAFTGISGNISALNNVGTQLTSLTNAVNTDQTYVLVVAALAAITLVLELAILVRKLS